MELKSLIDKPKELLNFINACLRPKDLEKKQFGEVFTPINIINDMLDTLPNEVWNNKDLTWFDPAAGMGNFPIIIYLRLMKTLTCISDTIERKEHILSKMLFMAELNKKNVFIMKQIFNFPINVYEGDTLTMTLEKYDIIVGNPPYNEQLTRSGAIPLYNKFIEKLIDKCNYLLFIIPSRWFAGGKGLDKFREKMLKRTDILFIKHFDDASKIFGNSVSIEGGVNYFLIDKSYNGPYDYNGNLLQLNKYDILVDSKYYKLIDKLINYDNINKYYYSQDHYKIQTNDHRLIKEEKENYIKCYVSQQNGFMKYIQKDLIKVPYNFYKVITARANGGNGCFGNIFIGEINEVHSKSYISFKVNSKEEGESMISYLRCKLPNLMLSIRKITQDISKKTCEWIPLVSLDRIWTNDKVYKYFKLTNEEIEFIESIEIKGYYNS